MFIDIPKLILKSEVFFFFKIACLWYDTFCMLHSLDRKLKVLLAVESEVQQLPPQNQYFTL